MEEAFEKAPVKDMQKGKKKVEEVEGEEVEDKVEDKVEVVELEEEEEEEEEVVDPSKALFGEFKVGMGKQDSNSK